MTHINQAIVEERYNRWKHLAESIDRYAKGTRARNAAIIAADQAWHEYEAADDEVNGVPNRYSFSMPPTRNS